MRTHILSEPFVCIFSKWYQEGFGEKLVIWITKQLNEENQDDYSVQENPRVDQERKPSQKRHISLILEAHVYTLLMNLKWGHVFLLKASYSLCQPDCCFDGVVIAYAWTWSLFLVFWFYNTNQLTLESTNHFRIICGRNSVPGLSEYLLGISSDKIKKVPASELAEWGR